MIKTHRPWFHAALATNFAQGKQKPFRQPFGSYNCRPFQPFPTASGSRGQYRFCVSVQNAIARGHHNRGKTKQSQGRTARGVPDLNLSQNGYGTKNRIWHITLPVKSHKVQLEAMHSLKQSDFERDFEGKTSMVEMILSKEKEASSKVLSK